MIRWAEDAMKAERNEAIRRSIKAKVPWTEIAESFGITEREVIEIVTEMGLAGPPRKQPDDIMDSRDEPKRGGR